MITAMYPSHIVAVKVRSWVSCLFCKSGVSHGFFPTGYMDYLMEFVL